MPVTETAAPAAPLPPVAPLGGPIVPSAQYGGVIPSDHPVGPATIPSRPGQDRAVWIVGGAMFVAGCVVPIVVGLGATLLAWLVFDTGLKLSLGIGLGAALLSLFGVLGAR